MKNLFCPNVLPEEWDSVVTFQTVYGDSNLRRLLTSIPCGEGVVEFGYVSDGSTSPFIANAFIPRHEHPIAYFRHDKRCDFATTWKERRFADSEYRKDVRSYGKETSYRTKAKYEVQSVLGYVGVTLGSTWWKTKTTIRGVF